MGEPMYAECRIGERRLNSLASVDQMSPGQRACVHEFGLPIVNVLRKFGVSDPRHIREIVKEIWLGPRQEGQRGGVRTTLDVLLAKGPISYATLSRVLEDNNLAIVSTAPTRAMLNASMAEVSGGGQIMTKEEKHRRRLIAAIRAASTTLDKG